MIVVHSWWPQVRLFKFILFFNELPSQLQSTVRDFWNEYQLTFDALVWTVTKANNTLEPHKPRPECRVCVSFFIIWKPQAEIPDAFMYNYEFDETKCDENFSPAPLELVEWTYWRLCQMKTPAIVKWHNFGLFNRTNENDAMTKTKPNRCRSWQSTKQIRIPFSIRSLHRKTERTEHRKPLKLLLRK